MDIPQMFKNIVSLFRRKKSDLQQEEDQTDSEIIRQGGKKTSLKPPIPEVKGIKRKTVLLLAAFFILAFFISLYFSMQNRSPSTKINSAVQEPAAPTAASGMNRYPNSYDELGRINAKQNGQAGLTGQQNNGEGDHINYNAAGNQYNGQRQQRPPINYPGNYEYGTSNAYYPPQYIAQAPEQKDALNEMANYLKSPIAFALAGLSTGGAGTAAAPVNSIAVQDSTSPIATGPAVYTQAEPYVLQQGTVIPSLLLTGIDSDLPGQVVAQVQENIFDSVTGQYLLIPQGTRIIGAVSKSAVSTGQNRIGVTWSRMIMPNGDSVDLGSMEGVDTSGYSGLKDQVDNHTRKIVGATLLSSLLAAGAQIAAGNTDSDDESNGQLAVSGAATAVMNAGAKLLDKNININPTIRIRPGISFYVFLNKDMILRPYE